MTEMMQPRPLQERQDAAIEALRTRQHLWLVTSGSRAHMIPVSYVWDGAVLTMATFERSRTMANIRANGETRAAIGTTDDVVMVDGTAVTLPVGAPDAVLADRVARVAHDPRVLPGLGYLQMTPRRILVWNGFHEFGGRTVMLDGRWLREPVD